MTPNTGHPSARALLKDGVKATVATPVASIAAALVVALVCLVVLVTAGRTAATEAQVLASIDDIGTRLITVIDTSGTAAIHPDTVQAVADLPGITWAVGLGPASDALVDAPGTLAGTLPVGVPVRELVGPLPDDVVLAHGRLPQRPGEAIATRATAIAIGLIDGAGPVVSAQQQASLVGLVELPGALTQLAETVLIHTGAEPADTLRFVFAVADRATAVPEIAPLVTAAVAAEEPGHVAVETADGVIALQNMISGQLGASARQLTAIILVVGIAVVGVTMLGMVSARRRDFGRRRALGASRSALVVLVLVQVSIAATAGAVIGTASGAAAVALTVGSLPTLAYLAGLAALAVLTAMLGAVPPAVLAARRDPVRILRVP